MSAQSLQIITLVVPNPDHQAFGSADAATRLNSSQGYNFVSSFNIRTLASNGAASGNDVTGLLYTPDLNDDDPCIEQSAPYVPQNVTRQANLPQTDYDLIAIAPWVDANCSLKYMEAARQDPVRGFIFFLPGNSTETPPEAKDSTWSIGDSTKWKEQNGYPVYAIPSLIGANMMNESAAYSVNMTDVPHGHELTESGYDPKDYVRLYVEINTGNAGNALPSLWVFLLVVLGILLAIIGLTSLSMHWLQRRRRQALRRRVASGEVDLEALGIKRLTVPQDLLNEMPLYIYGTGAPVSDETEKAATVEEEKVSDVSHVDSATSLSRPAPAVRSTSYRPTPLSQPTCAICLDDFVPASSDSEGTTVRELPCHHIFHPECVDTFLRDSSSLCPMCKKTALPKGYCPKIITNAMVRRERMVRGIRERVTVDADSAEMQNERQSSVPLSVGDRIRHSVGWPSRRLSSMPYVNSQQMQQMGSTTSPPDTADTTAPPQRSGSDITAVRRVQPPATPGRREWARQRAENMLGQRAPEDPESEEAQRTPVWRKAVRGLFPGFRR